MMSTLSESFFLPNIFAGGYNMTSGTASLVINEDEDKSPPIKIVVNRDNDEAINPHVLSRFAGASSSDFGSRASSRASNRASSRASSKVGGGFGGRFSGDSFGGCAKLPNQINLSPKVINKIVVQKSTAKTVVLIPLLRLMNPWIFFDMVEALHLSFSWTQPAREDSSSQIMLVISKSVAHTHVYMVSSFQVFKPAAVNG
jgi:hypothetical protein